MIKSMPIKIIISFITIILLVNIFYIPASHAMGPLSMDPSVIESATDYAEKIASGEILNPDPYNPKGVNQSDVGQMAVMTGTILAYIRNIGIIASVIVLTLIGIKYMLGSLEQKADYKENMYLYVIGCFLLMMGTTIPSIVYDIVK